MNDQIVQLLREALGAYAAEKGVELPAATAIELQKPKSPEHGDFATNIAMQSARVFRSAPKAIAEGVVAHFPENNLVEKLDIAGPGYINIFLSATVFHDVLLKILEDGKDFGRSEGKAGRRTQLEFVSANPTGPLNVVNGRAASLGDSLKRMFAYSGILCESEFYINDAGNQVRLLGESIRAHLASLLGDEHPFPEQGYQGAYVRDLADRFRQERLQPGQQWASIPTETLSEFGTKAVLADQKRDLADFRVEYDVWFSEKESLHKTGEVMGTFDFLEQRGVVYEDDGAKWLRTSDYGDEKDRILIKSDGTPTYFLADIAYHRNKFNRGFQRVIDIWGPDHHGHVIRMKAALQACGIDPDRFIILIAQTVRLKKGDEIVKFSKRKGEFYTLQELMEDTDINSMRYFFVSRRFDTHLDFDIELARDISDKNPAYYAQYVHARVASIFRKAEERGVAFRLNEQAVREKLVTSADKELIFALSQFPEIVQRSAENFEPHHICYELQNLGKLFHKYYHDNQILQEDRDPDLTQARLALVHAVQHIFALGLGLIGLDAPERM